MSTNFILLAIPYLPLFLALLYTLIKYRILQKEFKVFAFYLLVSFCIQVFASVLSFFSINNQVLLHVYVFVVPIPIVWFYILVLEGYIAKKILNTVLLLFLMFTVVNSIFFQKMDAFNSHAITVLSVLLVILSLSTFLLLLEEKARNNARNNHMSLNWINSGFFIYHASSLILFYLGDVIMKKTFPLEFGKSSWLLHAFFLTTMYTCFLIGLWKSPKH